MRAFERLEGRELLTVAITSVTELINRTNATATTVQGTGDIGDVISVVATDGIFTTPAVTTTVASNSGGLWSITLSVNGLRDGTITYTATDTTHGPPTATRTATKDTVAPGILIVSISNPTAAGVAGTATVRGAGEIGASVSLTASDGPNSIAVRTTTIGANGIWTISGIDLSELDDGSISITATATDVAGNIGTPDEITTTKVTADGRLSGFVYLDANKNNVRNSNERPLKGVTITLTGRDKLNNFIPSRQTTTASDGSYHFTGLLPGTYSIQESQPTKFNSYKAKSGNLGGVAHTNIITKIDVSAGEHGQGYNFGEKGLAASAISINPFLASSAPTQQQLDQAVASGSTPAPIVRSISKRQADQSSASAVSYDVKFNRSVTGVDASDFRILTDKIGSSSISRVTGSGTDYIVRINTGTGNGMLALALFDNDTIVDKSKTPLGGLGVGNGDFIGGFYTIAKSPAIALTLVTSPITSSNSSSTSASGTGEPGAIVALVASDGTHSTPALFAVVNSAGIWTINGINVSTFDDGPITYKATAINEAGKTAIATKSAVKDVVAPAVTAISLADANPTSASIVHYTVTFNDEVSGVGIDDFALVVTGGIVGAKIDSIDPISVSGTTYTVTVSFSSGTGTLGLNLVDDDTIVDDVANRLGGAGVGNGSFTGLVYTIVAPSV